MRRRRSGSAVAVAAGLAAATLGACLATVGALPAARHPAPLRQTADLRYDGEYGLWVVRDADSIRVSWFTPEPGPGMLEVVINGRVEHRLDSPPGAVHQRAFRHRGGGTILLRYGSAGGSAADESDRHETTLNLDATRRRPAVAITGVDSIFVMGDIHGEFDTLMSTLRNARVIDDAGRWSAGRAHFAVVGDMTDRGKDVVRVLWFLYALEQQAAAAGGRVHIVLGNHEIMVMLDDLRYVHPKELSIAEYHGVTYDRMFDPRRSILGSWLASKPALVRIDDVLLAHGGVSTDYLGYTLQSYDDTLASYVREDLFDRWADTTYRAPLDSAAFARRVDFFWGDRSVFWYRGYAQSDTLGDALASVLRRYRAAIHIVGHTPGSTIREAYGGSFIMVNTIPFAAELLLLERKGRDYERWRFKSRGPPERL